MSDSIEVFAPTGIPEISPGADLAALILATVEAHPAGPLRDGDILVVTSKIVSKAEGRVIDAADRTSARAAESRRIVARRGDTVIVEHRLGLVHAAAGIDTSNVAPGSALLLPSTPMRRHAGSAADWPTPRGCDSAYSSRTLPAAPGATGRPT